MFIFLPQCRSRCRVRKPAWPRGSYEREMSHGHECGGTTVCAVSGIVTQYYFASCAVDLRCHAYRMRQGKLEVGAALRTDSVCSGD